MDYLTTVVRQIAYPVKRTNLVAQIRHGFFIQATYGFPGSEYDAEAI